MHPVPPTGPLLISSAPPLPQSLKPQGPPPRWERSPHPPLSGYLRVGNGGWCSPGHPPLPPPPATSRHLPHTFQDIHLPASHHQRGAAGGGAKRLPGAPRRGVQQGQGLGELGGGGRPQRRCRGVEVEHTSEVAVAGAGGWGRVIGGGWLGDGGWGRVVGARVAGGGHVL